MGLFACYCLCQSVCHCGWLYLLLPTRQVPPARAGTAAGEQQQQQRDQRSWGCCWGEVLRDWKSRSGNVKEKATFQVQNIRKFVSPWSTYLGARKEQERDVLCSQTSSRPALHTCWQVLLLASNSVLQGVLQGPAGNGLLVRAVGPEEHLVHAHPKRQPAIKVEQEAEEPEDRNRPSRAREEVPAVQLDAKDCRGASLPLAAGEQAYSGVYSVQVLPGEVQDPAPISAMVMWVYHHHHHHDDHHHHHHYYPWPLCHGHWSGSRWSTSTNKFGSNSLKSLQYFYFS